MKNERHYNAGQFYVHETKDERNRAVREYQDKRGLTVLKQVESDGDDLETFYVYDEFGNLRVVIPPKVAAMGRGTLSATVLAEGCYVYEYDARQRMISQQVPGADPVWMVYDQGDRLVMTQDGNQRTKKQWSFTKYDHLNRPILIGLLNTTTVLSRAQMENNVKNQHTTEHYQGQENNAHQDRFGYSNVAYPSIAGSNVTVLSVTYYDHYRFKNDMNWSDGFDFQDVSEANPVANYLTDYFSRVQGQLTGTQVRVLGTDDWQQEAVYYDDAGRTTHTLRQHYGYNEFYSGVNIQHRYTHDHAGRVKEVYHRIGNEAEALLAANTYNALGELVKQDLHRFQDESFLQSVNYRYNERGWLTAINGVALGDNDLFGMELEYTTGPNPQYNGNISAAQWVNQTEPGGKRGYEYSYDALDRLTGANYVNVDNPTQDGYDVFGTTAGGPITYDANGNIGQLTRYGADHATIDELAYDYGTGVGNQLQTVTDGGNGQGFVPGEGGMDDDYYYDENGNLTDDYHRGITVTYNHLNLPERISFTATGHEIRYTYDASGTKLMKEVEYGAVNEQTIYMSGIEYYSPNFQNTNSTRYLSFIATDYGRVYPYFPLDTDPCATLSQQTTNEGRAWVYHYDLTDHLGNVRVTTASERVTDTYVATMESEVQGDEALVFRHLDTRHTDQLRNTTGSCDVISNPNESAHLRVLSETDQRVFGPAKSLAVQPGDKIKLSVMAQYVPSDDNSTYTADLAMLFLSAFTGGGAGALESGSAAYQGLSSFFGGQALLGRDQNDVPRAYLRYQLFDKDFKAVAQFNDQHSMRISAAGANTAEAFASGEITIDQPGYLYVWVSNESNWPTSVFFDDLIIAHEHGKVVQAQDFYPFGMAHQTHTRYENKHLYQGKEWQHELALNWFDFHARQYDPALGRFNGLDPQNQFASGYVGMGNNPGNMIDPDGQFAGALVGKFVAGMAHVMFGGALMGADASYKSGGNPWAGAAQGAFSAGMTYGLGAFAPSGTGGALYRAGISALVGSATGGGSLGDLPSSALQSLPGAFVGSVVGDVDRSISLSREIAYQNVWTPFKNSIVLPPITILWRGFRMIKPSWWGDTELFTNPVYATQKGYSDAFWSHPVTQGAINVGMALLPVPKFGLGRLGAGGANTAIRSKAIVIGEGMGAVKTTAKTLQAQGINAKWYQAWSKNFPTNRLMTPNEFSAAQARNARWLNTKINQGYKIYDIGIDVTRVNRSPFYLLERNILRKRGYPTTIIPR